MEKALAAFFETFRDSPEAQEDAADAGFELDEIEKGRDAISARPADAGLDPITTGIVIHVAGHFAVKAWEKVIWPWLKQHKLGDDGLGQKTGSDK